MTVNDTVPCCPYCGEEVSHVGEDGIDVCRECDTVVEGATLYVPQAVWEDGPDAVLAYATRA